MKIWHMYERIDQSGQRILIEATPASDRFRALVNGSVVYTGPSAWKAAKVGISCAEREAERKEEECHVSHV